MSHKLWMIYGLLVISASFAYVVYQGYRYRTSTDPLGRYTTGRDELQLTHHQDATNLALWYVPLGVLFIEIGVLTRPPGLSPAILWVHLPFAVAFFILLIVLRFWMTGLKSRHHKHLGRTCTACFAGMFSTGAAMIAM
jgi:hypothetical protein